MMNVIANSPILCKEVKMFKLFDLYDVFFSSLPHSTYIIIYKHAHSNLPNRLNWDKLWCWMSTEQNIKCTLTALKIESSWFNRKQNAKKKRKREREGKGDNFINSSNVFFIIWFFSLFIKARFSFFWWYFFFCVVQFVEMTMTTHRWEFCNPTNFLFWP